MYYKYMKIAQILNKAHFLIQAKEVNKITQLEMGERLGISGRTYTEYLRGTNSPKAMKALLNLLAQLDDRDLVTIVKLWAGEKS